MALTGTNGDNQTNIGSSKSIDYSLYDASNAEISVANQRTPIEFWIPKDTSVPIQPYSLIYAVNASSQNQTDSQGFMLNGFNLTGTNVSIHIQLKPVDTLTPVAYMVLLKFGANPVFNTNYYDLMNVFCPADLQSDSFYLTFLNMSRVNGFKGYIGISVREFNLSRGEIDCENKSFTSFDSSGNFTQNYYLRIYAAGCYYMDTLTLDWTSYGMEILFDTNITHAHCTSSHLTTFAGGFIVLPNAIDFSQVWANASFLQNPVLYATVICLICLYVLLAIWARYADWKDSQKCGITLLGGLDKNKEQFYIYEIMLFTGNRLNAGTKSKVVL